MYLVVEKLHNHMSARAYKALYELTSYKTKRYMQKNFNSYVSSGAFSPLLPNLLNFTTELHPFSNLRPQILEI